MPKNLTISDTKATIIVTDANTKTSDGKTSNVAMPYKYTEILNGGDFLGESDSMETSLSHQEYFDPKNSILKKHNVSVKCSDKELNFEIYNFETLDVVNSDVNLTLSCSPSEVKISQESILNLSYKDVSQNALSGFYKIGFGSKFSLSSDTGFDIGIEYVGMEYKLKTTSHHLNQDMLEDLVTLSANINDAATLTSADFHHFTHIPADLRTDFVLSNLKVASFNEAQIELLDSQPNWDLATFCELLGSQPNWDSLNVPKLAKQYMDSQNSTTISAGSFVENFENKEFAHVAQESNLAFSSENTGISAENAELAGAEDYQPCEFCGF